MVKKLKILVIGGTGQLGSALNKISLDFDNLIFFFPKKTILDITNPKSILKQFQSYNPNVVINCAAYTNVVDSEKCKKKCDLINYEGVINISKACDKFSVKLVHISTDYVFDGNKKTPYLETDLAKPINYYGLSKLKAEKFLLNYNLKGSIIIRTAWLYSENQNNFVSKIIHKINLQKKIKVVEDEIGSLTNADDLAKAIIDIIPILDNNDTEIYHYSGKNYSSRYNIAVEINKKLNYKNLILPVKNVLTEVKRPKYSVLDCKKIESVFGIKTINWKKRLNQHLEELKYVN